VDAGCVVALRPLQGGFAVSDRPARDERRRRGRQNRVVLAPVAGVKSAEAHEPDRASLGLESVDDGDKTNSSPGRSRHTP
jgi:hypothetical protein